jgi:hypothetical protein
MRGTPTVHDGLLSIAPIIDCKHLVPQAPNKSGLFLSSPLLPHFLQVDLKVNWD